MAFIGKRHVLLGVIIATTALLSLLTDWRFSQRGRWLPKPPDQIGPWTATNMPLSHSAMAKLGDAPALGRSYTNPFKEKVETHVIATASFDAYHEPEMCQPGHGFSLTAEKRIPVFGSGKYVKAIILKSDVDGQRILMYSWTQYMNGETVIGRDLTDYRDAYPRFTIGLATAIDGRQTCIVRAYTQIHPSDPLGVQARRNLNEVVTGMYSTFLQDKQLRDAPGESD